MPSRVAVARWVFGLFVAGSVLACRGAPTSPPDGTAAVTGVVRVNGVPTAGVHVVFDSHDGLVTTVTTDQNGVYRQDLLGTIGQIGQVQVTVVPPPGTECANSSVRITPVQGQTTTVNFDCASTVTMTGGWLHISPGVSVECKLIIADAAPPGTTYVLEVTGPTEGGASGVVAGQPPFTGTLSVGGTARIQVQINRLGTYRNSITVTSPAGIVRTAVLNVLVTTSQGVCP